MFVSFFLSVYSLSRPFLGFVQAIKADHALVSLITSQLLGTKSNACTIGDALHAQSSLARAVEARLANRLVR